MEIQLERAHLIQNSMGFQVSLLFKLDFRITQDLLGSAGQLKCMATNLASENDWLGILDFKIGTRWYTGRENLIGLVEITGEVEKEPTY